MIFFICGISELQAIRGIPMRAFEPLQGPMLGGTFYLGFNFELSSSLVYVVVHICATCCFKTVSFLELTCRHLHQACTSTSAHGLLLGKFLDLSNGRGYCSMPIIANTSRASPLLAHAAASQGLGGGSVRSPLMESRDG